MQNNNPTLLISHIHLKHFRCFENTRLHIKKPIVLIEGINGAGKTSLLEALYYACYLRSFRTHLPRELAQFGHDDFFIKVQLYNQAFDHEVQVGFSQGKRLVKVDKKTIFSYKELLAYYRIISLTEDDLHLIKGTPQGRRTFIDHAILLHDPEYISLVRELRQVVNNRNSLFRSGNFDRESYMVWTEQLWEKSLGIQKKRIQLLKKLEQETNHILQTCIDKNMAIHFKYITRNEGLQEKFDEFMSINSMLYENELRNKRSQFGAHQDDILIQFQEKKSKSFSSRGQQKLVVLLIKIAQVKLISKARGPAIFLLDDFMTDFDENRIEKLLSILVSLNNQLIFTSPTNQGILSRQLANHGAHLTNLTY